MKNDQTPFRPVRLARYTVELSSDNSGNIYVRSNQPLSPYPTRLSDRLLYWADIAGDRTFIAKREDSGNWRQMTYKHTLALARTLGVALLERGLSTEQPLVIISGNDIEHAMLALAATYVGVPYASISPAYSLISHDFSKLRHAIRLLTPGLVFAADGDIFGAAIEAAVPEQIPLLFTRHPSRKGAGLFSELASAKVDVASAESARLAVGPKTITKYLLTSGTTSTPKAVIHTQQMLTSNQQMLLDCMPFLAEEPPVLVDWLPWNHTFGGNHNFGLALWNGGTLYIDDGKPVPTLFSETLRNLREISPTVYFNVPRGFDELSCALDQDRELSKTFFRCLKILFNAGAALAQPTWDRLHNTAERTIGERILMITGMGMTETSPFSLCANWDAGRAGGVGLPAPGTELKLAPVGAKLEARHKGPHVTPGYHRQPDLTRNAFDDEGFLRSGDAVRFIDPNDPQQGLCFDGRITEDFKLDTGTWVSVGPLRSRLVALGNPYIQDAVITGQNRSSLGAFIFPDVDSLRALCPDLPLESPLEELVMQPPVRKTFQTLLVEVASHATGSASRITRLMILVEPPSIDRGEITDKGTINQQAVLDCRADLVERLYAEQAQDDPLVIR